MGMGGGMNVGPGSAGMKANVGQGQGQMSGNMNSSPMSTTRSGRGPGLVASDVYRGVCVSVYVLCVYTYACMCVWLYVAY